MTRTYRVPFLTTEDGGDLIVSFALDEYASSSLTLLRTPTLEFILDDEARGVAVMTANDGSERELLVSVAWNAGVVHVASTKRTFRLDIAAVDAEEVLAAQAVLREMNFDHRFTLSCD